MNPFQQRGASPRFTFQTPVPTHEVDDVLLGDEFEFRDVAHDAVKDLGGDDGRSGRIERRLVRARGFAAAAAALVRQAEGQLEEAGGRGGRRGRTGFALLPVASGERRSPARGRSVLSTSSSRVVSVFFTHTRNNSQGTRNSRLTSPCLSQYAFRSPPAARPCFILSSKPYSRAQVT